MIASLGCEEKKPQAVNNIIDKSYLESRQYIFFQNKYRKEQQKRVEQKRFLTSFIKDNFKTAESLPESFTIGDMALKKSLGQKGTRNPFGLDTFYTVGKIQLDSITLFLCIQNQLSAYQNSILIGATLSERKILDIKPLAFFRNNLTEHMKSRLKIVSQKNVMLQVQHDIEYPEPQKIKTEYNFSITEKGEILISDTFGKENLFIDALHYGYNF